MPAWHTPISPTLSTQLQALLAGTLLCLSLHSCVAQSTGAVGDRKSKRARKGRAPVKISADETIHELKLKIVQTLNVHPRNMLLHLFRNSQWQPVSDDYATLAGKLLCCHADSDNRLPLGAYWPFLLVSVLWAVLCADQRLGCCTQIHCGLVDHSILPDEELVVINTHTHDDEDLESFFGVSSSNQHPQPEHGFTGTALSSHVVPAMPP